MVRRAQVRRRRSRRVTRATPRSTASSAVGHLLRQRRGRPRGSTAAAAGPASAPTGPRRRTARPAPRPRRPAGRRPVTSPARTGPARSRAATRSSACGRLARPGAARPPAGPRRAAAGRRDPSRSRGRPACRAGRPRRPAPARSASPGPRQRRRRTSSRVTDGTASSSRATSVSTNGSTGTRTGPAPTPPARSWVSGRGCPAGRGSCRRAARRSSSAAASARRSAPPVGWSPPGAARAQLGGCDAGPPGVGSNGTQPEPWKYSSGHACSSCRPTTCLPCTVWPRAKPTATRAGMPELARHHGHRRGEVHAVALPRLQEGEDRLRAVAVADRRVDGLVVGELVRVAQPGLQRQRLVVARSAGRR